MGNSIQKIIISLFVGFSFQALADQLTWSEARYADEIRITRSADINESKVRSSLQNNTKIYEVKLLKGDIFSLTAIFRDELHGAVYIYASEDYGPYFYLLDGKAPRRIKTRLNLDFTATSSGAYYIVVEPSPFAKRGHKKGRFVLKMTLQPGNGDPISLIGSDWVVSPQY